MIPRCCKLSEKELKSTQTQRMRQSQNSQMKKIQVPMTKLIEAIQNPKLLKESGNLLKKILMLDDYCWKVEIKTHH
jgi:hypothetical protein